jgi:hypothetical protein
MALVSVISKISRPLATSALQQALDMVDEAFVDDGAARDVDRQLDRARSVGGQALDRHLGDGVVQFLDQVELLGHADQLERAAAVLEAHQGLVVVGHAGLQVDHRLVGQGEAALADRHAQGAGPRQGALDRPVHRLGQAERRGVLQALAQEVVQGVAQGLEAARRGDAAVDRHDVGAGLDGGGAGQALGHVVGMVGLGADQGETVGRQAGGHAAGVGLGPHGAGQLEVQGADLGLDSCSRTESRPEKSTMASSSSRPVTRAASNRPRAMSSKLSRLRRPSSSTWPDGAGPG